MEVCYLEVGEDAPDDVDRVRIDALGGGKYGFSGVFIADEIAVLFFYESQFDSRAEAEQRAVEHAKERDVSVLYIEDMD